ncbi:MAG: PorT family protein [Bacteroidota bacterium]|nr:PorT family protein [Bacteroidota bacterium]
MKKLCLFLWCLIFLQAAFASDNTVSESDNDKVIGNNGKQNIERAEASPNFPGSLRIGLGLSFLRNAPEDMNMGWWKSRSVDIFYIGDMPLGNSRFTFNPGIGLGIERFGFVRHITLNSTSEGTVITDIGELNPSKSLLNSNYVDIPLELKYHFGANEFTGFNVAIGGRVGYLIDAKTKVNYEDRGELVKLKTKETYNLNRLRYGVTARIGLGRFNLYYYQNLSPLFKNNSGIADNDIYHYKFGLSFAAF